jgi:glycosyltransferase involved in cell wall biosynthesis
MRILHVVYTPRYSGAEILVLRMAAVQVRQGHQVQVLSLNPCDPAFHPEIEAQERQGIQWHVPGEPLGTWARLKHLWHGTRAACPDAVFAHSMIPALYMRCVSPAITIPVLHSQSNFVERKLYWLERCLSPLTRGVISVSATALREYQMLFPRVRSTLVENGVVLADYAGRSTRIHQSLSSCRLLHVGRVSRVKRTHLAIELVAALHEMSVDAELDVAGIIEDEAYHAELVSLANQRGLASKVRFLGARNDVALRLLQADCFVLPSANEAQCIALIEALAAGLPILASDIPGNRFAAAHPGVVLSDFRDMPACARSAMHLMSSGGMHVRDMSNFDVGAKAQQYIDFAVEALQASSTRV